MKYVLRDGCTAVFLKKVFGKNLATRRTRFQQTPKIVCENPFLLKRKLLLKINELGFLGCCLLPQMPCRIGQQISFFVLSSPCALPHLCIIKRGQRSEQRKIEDETAAARLSLETFHEIIYGKPSRLRTSRRPFFILGVACP